MITYGTNPGMGIGITQHVPSTSSFEVKEQGSYAKALAYMGLHDDELMLGKPIDYVFIGSCTNSRIEDLRQVAKFVEGKQKADNVTVWVVPGSKQVQQQAIREGLDKILEAVHKK